ncbi:MAG: FHA domain-containing protein [Lentisphaeria bacterium]|nr:FHA domain-containing protein [Lentisphaeria bacterium]
MNITAKNIQSNQIAATGELSAGKNVLLVGRGSDCDMILSSNAVSRKHARLMFINDMVFVEDLGSTGGTKVNDARISEMTEISANDKIQIANFVITLGDSLPVSDRPAAEPKKEPVMPKQPD